MADKDDDQARNRECLQVLDGYLRSRMASELPMEALVALRAMHAAGVAFASDPAAVLATANDRSIEPVWFVLGTRLARLLEEYHSLRREDQVIADSVLRARLPVLHARLLRTGAALDPRASRALAAGKETTGAAVGRESEYVRAAKLLHFLGSSGCSEAVDDMVVTYAGRDLAQQRALRQTLQQLDAWAAQRDEPPTIEIGPLPVRFSSTRILQPDLMLWLEPLPQEYEYPIRRVPDLVVNVQASSDPVTWIDHWDRSRLYADAGVSELWTIDPRRQLVEVKTYSSGALGAIDSEEEHVVSALLPGFRLDIRAVCRGCPALGHGSTQVTEA